MRSLSASRKLVGGFVTILALLALVSAVALWSASRICGAAERTVAEGEALRQISELQTINTAIFGAEKYMVISGMTDDKQLNQIWTEKLQAFITDGEKAAARVAATTESAADRKTAQALEAGMKNWNSRCDACHEIASELKTSPQKVLKLSADGERLMQTNADLATALKQSVERSFADRRKEASSAFAATRLSIVITALVSIGVALAVGWLLRDVARSMRSAIQRLGTGADRLVAVSRQVATSAQGLSQGATEQAASLEETSASMEEMASMTRRNAENSHEAARLMGEVDARVRDSNAALSAMVASMDAIEGSSRKVSKIIKTIDEIAFQTNILALNAAVEAARAGEAGMGFAVVADEVRSLAQRSAQAAQDTAELIEASIATAHSGSQNVSQVDAGIAGITASVAEAKRLVDDVSVASRQQSQGIDQVSQAIAQMEQVTQQTAASAEEGAAASEELTAEAHTTMTVVQQLGSLIGTSASATAAAQAPAPAAPTGPLQQAA